MKEKLPKSTFMQWSLGKHHLFLSSAYVVGPGPTSKKFYNSFAKLSSSSSPAELSAVLILIISTPTLDYLERRYLVWKLYSTKLGQLAN